MSLNRPAQLQIIDPVLTSIARQYKSHDFIADSLLTNVPVKTLTGQYPVFRKFDWFTNEVANIKADRAPSREIDFEWGTETYRCEEFALKVSITDLERMQAHEAVRLEANKTDLLSHRMSLAREVRIANILKKVADGGQIPNANSATPSNLWDTASANPDADIRTGALAVYDATGQSPDTLVLPYKVAYQLATNHGTDSWRAAMIYTVNGQQIIRLGDGILPSEIHGMQVVIAKGPQIDAANEGGASSISEIWGKNALLLTRGARTYGQPSSLYRFVHTAQTVTRWRETDPDLDYIRELERCDERMVAPDTAYILKGVVS